MDRREEGRREVERDEQEDLNQGMQTGTHDAADLSINWGFYCRIRESSPKPNPPANSGKDADAKS